MKTLTEHDNLISILQEIDTKNLDYWNFIMNDKTKKKLEIISFQQGFLILNFVKNNCVDIDFTNFFNKVNNIFNDNLPKNEYISLSNIITKLDLLDMKKSKNILLDWIDCLKAINEYLKKHKEEISEINFSFLEFFFQNFQLNYPEDDEYKIIIKLEPKENSYIENFNFSISYTENSKNLLFNLLKILCDCFKNCEVNNNEIELSIKDYEIDQHPNPPKINDDRPRGYLLKLKENIFLKAIKVLLSIEGEVQVYIINERNKMIKKKLFFQENFVENTWISIPIREIIKDNFSLFIHYTGKGSFFYNDFDSSERKINDKISVISKYLIINEILNSQQILDNYYSIKLILEY